MPQRKELVGPDGTAGPGSADHGGAIQPHGDPSTDESDPKVQAGADLEAKAAAAAGKDPAVPSAQAQTGGPNQQAGTKEQQAKAADAAKG